MYIFVNKSISHFFRGRNMEQQLSEKLEKYFDEMVSIRRHLHMHPELSFHETKTVAFIKDYYRDLNIPVRSQVGNGGIVATLTGKHPGRTVALRADFDALPIQDEKDVPYKSKVAGVMHACGHDGHTAALLVLAKSLKEMQSRLEGTYIFIHQHAEELAPGGAKDMIEDGCLEGVDVIFGTHLWAPFPTCSIYCSPGPIMASADRFQITIRGKGGHGAEPHTSKDSLVIAAEIVTMLQTITSRRIDPMDAAVLTFGKFAAGDAFNIIPDTAYLEGTVRTFKTDIQDQIIEEMERMVKGICQANNCLFEFRYYKGYPPTINHEIEAEYIKLKAKEIVGEEHFKPLLPLMIGEDFSYYLQHVKGALFLTGAAPEGIATPYPHHHPLFDFNEKAMLIAAKTLGNAAIGFQEWRYFQ